MSYHSYVTAMDMIIANFLICQILNIITLFIIIKNCETNLPMFIYLLISLSSHNKKNTTDTKYQYSNSFEYSIKYRRRIKTPGNWNTSDWRVTWIKKTKHELNTRKFKSRKLKHKRIQKSTNSNTRVNKQSRITDI